MRLPAAIFPIASIIASALAGTMGGAGCQKTNPGLALHVTLPAQALAAVDAVQVTLVPVSGSLGGTGADTTENGVSVHSEAGKVILTLRRSAFPLAGDFDVLVVPSGDSPVTANLTAEMYQSDGLLLGSSPATPAELNPDRRTELTLTLSCSRSGCEPVAAGRVFDLAAPNPAVKLLTINGAADGDKLAALGVGNFSTSGGDLVAASQPRGTVYIFFGRDWTIPGFATTLDTAAADVTIVGKAGETLGDAAAVGDFDGDGVDDLVVTATNATNPVSSKSGAGAAYLISGTRLGTAGAIDLPTQPADIRVYGESSQERLGSAVALAHLTSTTAVDLVVGAPGAAGGGGAKQAGRVYVVFGGSTPPAQVLVGDPATGEQDATILGPAASAQLGLALAAGDLDDDQVADVVLGNYLDGGKGSVHVVLGTRLTTAGAAVDLAAGDYDSRVVGTSGSQLGWSVAIGDVDGDGARDLIVGARQRGIVYLLRPPLDGSSVDVGQNQFEAALLGPASTFFGATLATGNVDGDSAADLLVGAPGSNGPDGQRAGAGAVHVVLGSQIGTLVAGEHRSIDLATTPAALTVHGAARNDGLGDHVVGGSVDISDALDEIIVGAQLGGTNARGVIHAIQNLPSQ
jgi:hypothetical protein